MDEQFQRAIRAAQDAQEQSRNASAGLREDLIETSVQFWNDPRMSDKTPESKEQFLEQKGLTRREIAEVRKRARVANPPPLPPNPGFAGGDAGRANIGGANIQYIPIPIPAAPGLAQAPPTFLQRVGGWVQMLGTGMAAIAGASYVYHQYANLQQHPRGNANYWNRLIAPVSGENQYTGSQGRGQGQGRLQGGGQEQGQGQGQGQGQALVPLGGDPDGAVGASEHSFRSAMEHRQETEDMKRSLRDMQERIELQSAQLRDALKSLNDIVSTQNTQAANHTSMGLLLANTAASQSSQERSVREELREIKEMIRDRLSRSSDKHTSNQGSQDAARGDESQGVSRERTSASAAATATDALEPTSRSASNSSASENAANSDSKSSEPTQEEKDASRQRKLETDLEERKSEILSAVAKVKDLNADAAALKKGYAMMEMLLQNLEEHPMMPRYRKIAISNKNFETRLKSLEGHENLLIACGFTKNTKSFEWSLLPKSHEVEEEEMEWAKKLNDAVLKFARGAITLLTTATSASPDTDADADTSSNSQSMRSPQLVPAGSTPVSRGASAILTTPEVESTSIRDAPLSATKIEPPEAKLSAPSSSSAIEGGGAQPPKAVAVAVPTQTSSTSAASNLLTSVPAVHGSVKVNATAAASTKVPQYPLAFQEVLKLVEEGKDPPGIRIIPEKLSSDAEKLLGSSSIHNNQSASRAKPWEAQPNIEILED